jgi:DNA-3-methyladenine glycosylase
MKKLPLSFYRREDLLAVARDLLGKLVVTRIGSRETIGRIVELEAYNGPHDRASHAYGNRRTPRTEVMYAPGGLAYVYLCYGIHHLFNVVTGSKDLPQAILIRGIEPLEGLPVMVERLGKTGFDGGIGRGPGNLSRAMGIQVGHSGVSLRDNLIFIAEDQWDSGMFEVGTSPRIGVGYAKEDALLPYRYFLKGHPHVSGPKNLNQ